MEDDVAVSSLDQTIKCLNDSWFLSTSRSSRAIMQVLQDTVRSLISTREREYDLPGQIRDAVLEMEDVLESHISNQFLSSQSVDNTPPQMPSFSVDLEEIKQDVDSFAETIDKILMGYSGSSSDDDDDDDDDVPSRVDFGGSLNDQYFGLSDQFTEIKDRLAHALPSDSPLVVLLHGMAGIGKTALAKKIFHDPLISSLYSKRVFVTVGQKCRHIRVFQDIQKQVMDSEAHGETMLIVLDDLWDDKLYSNLFEWDMVWPNRAAILLTSRLRLTAHNVYTMRFMDKKESWDLLRHKVFGGTPCPPQLEKAGKKVAEKCQGLPLTIVTVADIMSKADGKTTEEYWNKVATEKRNSVFMNAYDQMFEVLYLSYKNLRSYYRACFLYLAVFPQNHEISCSKLLNLFLAEGLYDSTIFEELVSNSMVIVHEQSLVLKHCSLHSSFWYMCNKEAGKIKLFHGVDSPDDLAEEDVKSQRRLCIRDNTILAFKDVYNSMASISKLRSLLCTGPYHQYPLPIHVCLEYFRLLRILDALKIRFYEFPMEVVIKLINLRYLALTYNGNLPASIFKLYNLHYLIVHRHQRIIKAVRNSSYLPMEIWLLKELKYLHIMGGNLPGPPFEELCLPKLKTLLDVGPQSCTKEVLNRMPNLEKLGILIELAPDSDDGPLCFFNHISHLHKLRKLKCIIVKPKITSPPPPLSIFPKYLYKLTLSGFGYSWEDMCKIAPLPNLQLLKLKCYAFRGPKWEVDHDDFPSLKYLLIEDSDLVHLTFRDSLCLPRLQQIVIKHCYKLQEIPLKFGDYIKRIELVDCNTLAVACAIKVKVDQDQRYDWFSLDLDVHSTWDNL